MKSSFSDEFTDFYLNLSQSRVVCKHANVSLNPSGSDQQEDFSNPAVHHELNHNQTSAFIHKLEL